MTFFPEEIKTILYLKMGKYLYFALFPVLYILITNLLHHFYFAGGFSSSKAVLHGKTVIITGANTGIGKLTAMDLAERGARVILACRSAKRALPVVEEIKAKTKNTEVLFKELDLASFDSIQHFSDDFLKHEERLDILINNAGMMSTSDEPHLTEHGIEITLMVNHLGHMFLTQNLLDLLKKSGPGSRIVSVSSLGHDFANPNAFKDLDNLKIDGAANFVELDRPTFLPRASDFLGVLFKPLMTKPTGIRYANSKLANVLFSKELSNRLAGSGVTTYSLHPGAILTELGVDRSTGKDVFGMDRKNSIIEKLMNLPEFINPFFFPFKTLVEGAQTSICCAVNEELANESGQYYSDCVAQHVYREELSGDFPSKFWEWSDSLIREATKQKK